MTEIGLNELHAFLEVARRRSFRQAADTLGVSRSSLSHAMRTLEDRLSARLLNRTTRSVSLTPAGQRLLDGLPARLQVLDDLLQSVSHGEDEGAGLLRLNAEPLAAQWLVQRVLPLFRETRPKVEIDLVADGRFIDIVAEGFDAGVRLGDSVPQDMIAVPYGGDIRFLAVASPAYLAAHGAPTAPEDLAHHECIRQRLPSGKRYRWEFTRRGVEVAIDVPGALSLNDNPLMVDAAVQGLGIAFVPEPLAAPFLEEGRLIAVLEDWTPAEPGQCLYYSSHRLVPPPLRAFIDVLREVDRRERTSPRVSGTDAV